ncbi:MAG: hypothetical protein ACI85O_002476, partial [Saprospiraceae bacterium]
MDKYYVFECVFAKDDDYFVKKIFAKKSYFFFSIIIIALPNKLRRLTEDIFCLRNLKKSLIVLLLKDFFNFLNGK